MQYGSHLLSSRAGVSLLIAASNASDSIQERADFICSGTNDDVMIQAAINALQSDGEDRRGTIELSEGDYQIAHPILVPGHTQILGMGWGTKLLAVAGLNDYMFKFQPHIVPGSVVFGAEGIRIAHLFMDHNAAAQTAGGHIDGYGARLCTIEQCHLTRPYENAIQWRGLSDGTVAQENLVTGCTIENGYLSAGDGRALYVTASNENKFVHNTVQFMGGTGTNPCCVYDNAGLNLYEGNIFVNSNNMIRIFFQEGCRIIGNIFDGGSGDQLKMDGNNHVVVGNSFFNVGLGYTANTARAIYMSSICNHCTIIGNVFSNDNGGLPATFIEESTSGNSGSIYVVGDNVIENNVFQANGGTFPVVKPNTLPSSFFRQNKGLTTEKKGTATITSGTTSIVVTHGLSLTPTVQDIQVTPTSNAGNFWVTSASVNATTFTITVATAAGAGGITFTWQAQIL